MRGCARRWTIAEAGVYCWVLVRVRSHPRRAPAVITLQAQSPHLLALLHLRIGCRSWVLPRRKPSACLSPTYTRVPTVSEVYQESAGTCVCVPQELEKQYSPSQWVVRLGAEGALKTYSEMGKEGTGDRSVAARGGLGRVAGVQNGGGGRGAAPQPCSQGSSHSPGPGDLGASEVSRLISISALCFQSDVLCF